MLKGALFNVGCKHIINVVQNIFQFVTFTIIGGPPADDLGYFDSFLSFKDLACGDGMDGGVSSFFVCSSL